MELKQNSNKSFYIVILASAAFLLLLGTWWLYLVFKLALKLEELNHPQVQGDLLSMIKWEGASFIILLFILTLTLIYVYLQDYKKNKAIQSFFASLTHELKSPLASMKLQAQVVQEMITKLDISDENKNKLSKYSSRLFQDSVRLEDKLDNSLQLSRVERGASLNLRPLNLVDFINEETKRFVSMPQLEINLNSKSDKITVLADDFGLQTVIRNLIENTLRHNKKEKKIINITINQHGNDSVEVKFDDKGSLFEGEMNKLTQLFYKHNSPSGSGVGLYLTKRLMTNMQGQLIIENDPHLIFKLILKKVVA